MEFAQFNPILEPNKEEMLSYYQNFNIPVPDNTQFRNYFDIRESDIPEISQSTSSPKQFSIAFSKKEPEKKVGIWDTTPEQLSGLKRNVDIPLRDKQNEIVSEIQNLFVSEDDKDYLIKLAKRESNYNPDVTNRYGYFGLYQFGDLALKDVGTTKEQFKDTLKQHEGALKLAKLNESRLKDIIDEFEGKSFKGIKVTRNGIRAAAHLLGAGSVKDFFQGTKRTSIAKKGFVDANNTHITEYLRMFQ